MSNMLSQLSDLEKQLVDDQEIVTVRGKHGSPVPILIPKDTAGLLHIITDTDTRSQCGVIDTRYVFAQFGKKKELV
jgi:hypothetical protein